MPLTQLQARDKYLIDSMVQFLGRNLKPQYDAAVAADPTLNPATLKIFLSKPDDYTQVVSAPSISVARIPGKTSEPYEVGSSNMWRFQYFVFTCYPSLNSENQPSSDAKFIMESMMRDVFSGLFISVIDYSNPQCNAQNIIFCLDGLYITTVSVPQDLGVQSTLAQERHKFVMRVEVKYPVAEVLVK